MFERIEAFRRRKPRLLDDVVTLAHGAGGKASAALLDAVFLPAFANDALAAQTDAAVLDLPSGDRLAFSTDSYVVHPLRFPAASVGHLAVHGTVNDLADDGRAAARTFGGVRARGGIPDRRHCARSSPTWPRPPPPPASTSSPATPRSSIAVPPTGCTSRPSGVGVIPAGRELSAERVRPGDVVLVSGTIADHGMAVMLARGDLALEADIVSDTAPLNGLMECLLAAAPVDSLAARRDAGRRRHGLQRTRPGLQSDGRAGGGRASRPAASGRRLRVVGHRSALRGQRRQVRRCRRRATKRMRRLTALRAPPARS